MTEETIDNKAPFDVMDVPGGAHVKMWTRGVPVDEKAKLQLAKAAAMPFVFKHVAAMPDVHVGIGGCGYRLRYDGGTDIAPRQ
jgi:hypothetical protein